MLSIALLCINTACYANFSNIIIFGDSLSDVGNFPESPALLKNPTQPPSITNLIAQVYVPFSNPVNTVTAYFYIPVALMAPSEARPVGRAPQPLALALPRLASDGATQYLTAQATLNNQKKLYRSMAWPQFFLPMTQQKINSSQIVPNIILNDKKIPKNFSVNYSWGYATSSEECVNPYYEPRSCTDAEIIAARKNYFLHPDQKNYKNILVPGIQKQVDLFLQDYRNKKVSADQNTMYIFWIGGNDLIVAANNLLYHFYFTPALHFLFGLTAVHTLFSIHYLLRALPEKNRPEKIFVFELFNPYWTPLYYHTPLGHLGNFFVNMSNAWLHIDAMIFNHLSETKIIVVPAYTWYQAMGNSAYFQAQNGKLCQLSGGDYMHATVIPKDNCVGFLFWNAVHPAMPAQIMTAYYFSDFIGR